MATRRSGGSNTLLIILLVLALAAAAAWALGLFSADIDGKLRAPDVNVSTSGGSLPSVDVDTAKVDVGTKKETIEVPTVSVQKAGEAEAAGGDNK